MSPVDLALLAATVVLGAWSAWEFAWSLFWTFAYSLRRV